VLKGDGNGARAAFEHALALDPNYIDALNGVIGLDFQAKNSTAARSRIEARVAAAPNNAAVLMVAGRTYLMLSDFAAAEKTLTKVLEIDAAQFDAYSLLGSLYASQRRLNEARNEFERLASVRPKAAVGAGTLVGMMFEMENKKAE